MKNWQDALVDNDISFETAIATLNRVGLRILFFVDADQKLLGTLTDGDVRRAILKRVPLESPVSEVMNAHPRTVEKSETSENAINLMESLRLLHMPVVDADGRLVDVLEYEATNKKKTYDNPVFIMAGGFGKRLYPLTEDCPKPMLKVGGRPILEHILVRCLNAGFYRIFISTHYLPEVIRDYFQDGSKWGLDIQYIHEEEPLGTGGALGLLPPEAIDRPVLMMNGDLMTSVDFASLLNSHIHSDAIATVCVRDYEYQVPFGVIEQEMGRVKGMIEKPIYRSLVNAGIYVLNPDFVRNVEPKKRVDMPSLLQQVLDGSGLVDIFPVHESWTDVGQHEDFQKVQENFFKLGVSE